MMAKRQADGWTGTHAADRLQYKRPARIAAAPGSGKRARWRDHESRLVEVLLEFTTIAGLFALLFALFVLFGAAQTLSP
ncbi:hypothetical protein [Azospirillum palustre]